MLISLAFPPILAKSSIGIDVMDANGTALLFGIISGLVANAVTPVLAVVTRLSVSAALPTSAREWLGLAKSGESELRRRIESHLSQHASNRALRPILGRDAVLAALNSPAIEVLIRGLFSDRLQGEKPTDIDQVKVTFRDLVTRSIADSKYDPALPQFLDTTFDIIIDGINKAFADAVESGALGAHDAKEAFRHNIVLSEIRSMSNLLQRWPDLPASEASIFAFETKYSDQVKSRCSMIMPPQLDTARKVPIDDIYVSSELRTRLKAGSEEQIVSCDHKTLMAGTFRSVVLGDPGGGKSTLAEKIAYDVAGANSRIFGFRAVTPVLIILREYGAALKEEQISILEFVEQDARARYQIRPPSGAFELLLHHERLLFIFDGLDELLDTSDRRRVAQAVESFCNLYPGTPVIVTSRREGYREAPLDEQKFDVFELAAFSDEKVAEYVHKWFHLHLPDEPAQSRKRHADNFMRESEIAPDLRRSPLMLGLMCNLYRGASYIPQNRPDIFRRCSELLFQKWDQSRGIRHPLPFQAHLYGAISYLAYWLYTAGTGAPRGVPESRIVKKAAEYLAPRLYESSAEAIEAAEAFVKFCVGRAWVFSDIGTDPAGERLFQFTHATFREYFAAAHLVLQAKDVSGLLEELLPRVRAQEWDMVAQLSVQMNSAQHDGGAEEALQILMRNLDQNRGKEAWYILSFSVRSLSYLVPPPTLRREVIRRYLRYVVDTLALKDAERQEDVEEIVADAAPSINEFIFDLSNENGTTVRDEACKFFRGLVQSDSVSETQVGLEAFQSFVSG